MPDGISNVNPQLLKLAEQYHSCNVRSGLINEERAQIRENVDKLGIDPGAFQVGVRMARDMTKGERGDFTESLDRVLEVMDGKEADIFGAEEMRKRDERSKKRHDKEAQANGTETAEQQERRLAADTSPRSDPKSGGAGKAAAAPKGKRGKGAKGAADVVGLDGKPHTEPPADAAPLPDEEVVDDGEGPPGETGDEMILRVSKKMNAEREQREGAATLSRVENIGENGKPLSQSAQAAAVREQVEGKGRLN